jgi:hypothetical protein
MCVRLVLRRQRTIHAAFPVSVRAPSLSHCDDTLIFALTTAALRFPCTCVQAYDQHLNMILGEVEETMTSIEIDDETYEEIIKVRCLTALPQQLTAMNAF